MREKLLEELLQYAGEDKETGDEIFLLSLLDDAAEEVCNIMYPYGLPDEQQMQSAINSAYSKYSRKIKKLLNIITTKEVRKVCLDFLKAAHLLLTRRPAHLPHT